jgi:hypothetical protein
MWSCPFRFFRARFQCRILIIRQRHPPLPRVRGDVLQLQYNARQVPTPSLCKVFLTTARWSNVCLASQTFPGQQDALQMDTGLLVTNTYLGLNAPPEGQTTTSRCGDMFTNACPRLSQVRNNTGDARFPLQAHNTSLIEEITSYTLPVILSAIIM